MRTSKLTQFSPKPKESKKAVICRAHPPQRKIKKTMIKLPMKMTPSLKKPVLPRLRKKDFHSGKVEEVVLGPLWTT